MQAVKGIPGMMKLFILDLIGSFPEMRPGEAPGPLSADRIQKMQLFDPYFTHDFRYSSFPPWPDRRAGQGVQDITKSEMNAGNKERSTSSKRYEQAHNL